MTKKDPMAQYTRPCHDVIAALMTPSTAAAGAVPRKTTRPKPRRAAGHSWSSPLGGSIKTETRFEKEFFDKVWVLPDVEKVAAQ